MASSPNQNHFSTILSWLLNFIFFTLILPSSCLAWVNGGFETGNTNGWTVTSGVGSTPYAMPSVSIVTPGPATLQWNFQLCIHMSSPLHLFKRGVFGQLRGRVVLGIRRRLP